MPPGRVRNSPAVGKKRPVELPSARAESGPRLVGSPPSVDKPTKAPSDTPGTKAKPRKFTIPWSPKVCFSSPLPGAPKVCWRHGSTPEIIIEMWPDPGHLSRLPLLAFMLNEFRRIVIYHRDRPHIRALFQLGELNADGRQEVLSEGVESNGLLTKKEFREAADLVEEFAKIDERGRPRGSRRPKRKHHEMVQLSADQYLEFGKCGLTSKQIRVLTAWARGVPLVKIARDLHISPPAVSRLLKRAENNLRKTKPDFSLSDFKRAPEPEHLGTGHRWKKQQMVQDKSGNVYRQDPKKLFE